MIPIHVALVPYYEEADEQVNPSTVLRVAAALQMQLTRDFTPIWGIPAVVSPFLSLDQVPPGCMPLVIVKPDSLTPRAQAFHITEQGQPIALVEGRRGWSLAASHELLEMVCDPSGHRTVMGDSIADSADPMAIVRSAEDYPWPQGQVAYLLEICDPCQTVHYTVNGFQVSDFVTPRYYAPGEAEDGRFSFTGRVTKPREVRPGGYITWYTSMPGAATWQAIRDPNGDFRIGPMTGAASAYSRHDVDYLNDLLSGLESAPQPSVPAVKTEDAAEEAAKRYGHDLKLEVERILAGYLSDREPPSVRIDALLEVLKNLATDADYWDRFQRRPDTLYDELQHALPTPLVYPGGQFPTQQRFQDVYDAVKKLTARQQDVRVSDMVATTMMLGFGGSSGGTIVDPTKPKKP